MGVGVRTPAYHQLICIHIKWLTCIVYTHGHGLVSDNNLWLVQQFNHGLRFLYRGACIRTWKVWLSLSLSLLAPLGHTSVVTCLAAHSDNVLVLSGSEDSSAKLTNTNTGKVSGRK